MSSIRNWHREDIMEARGVRVTANLLEEERPPEGLLDLVGGPSSSGAGRGAAAGKDKDVQETPDQTEHSSMATAGCAHPIFRMDLGFQS